MEYRHQPEARVIVRYQKTFSTVLLEAETAIRKQGSFALYHPIKFSPHLNSFKTGEIPLLPPYHPFYFRIHENLATTLTLR